MPFRHSTFAQVIAPLCRSAFRASVARHNADAYDKKFDSWQHLLALIFAQLSGSVSLRALVASWNAHPRHHYHCGAGELAKSTLADANQRRPEGVFMDTFAQVSGLAMRKFRHQGKQMLRLIDSSPIQVSKLVKWASSNGRIHGLKLHVVYDPQADHPRLIDVTPATVNDIEFGKTVPIEAGATYIFDKGYCSYAWWTFINAAGAFFVTRSKNNVRYDVLHRRKMDERHGDGFVVRRDHEVKLASKGDSKLPIPLRLLKVKRQGEKAELTIITNDLTRSAVEIASLYKTRWQIELLFRWIKQHFKIRSLLGRSENAVRIQVLAAMIAYVLLRIAAQLSRMNIPLIRFAELIATCLFRREQLLPIGPNLRTLRPKPPPLSQQLQLDLARP